MENEIIIQSEPQATKPAIKYGWLRALLFLIVPISVSTSGLLSDVSFTKVHYFAPTCCSFRDHVLFGPGY